MGIPFRLFGEVRGLPWDQNTRAKKVGGGAGEPRLHIFFFGAWDNETGGGPCGKDFSPKNFSKGKGVGNLFEGPGVRDGEDKMLKRYSIGAHFLIGPPTNKKQLLIPLKGRGGRIVSRLHSLVSHGGKKVTIISQRSFSISPPPRISIIAGRGEPPGREEGGAGADGGGSPPSPTFHWHTTCKPFRLTCRAGGHGGGERERFDWRGGTRKLGKGLLDSVNRWSSS